MRMGKEFVELGIFLEKYEIRSSEIIISTMNWSGSQWFFKDQLLKANHRKLEKFRKFITTKKVDDVKFIQPFYDVLKAPVTRMKVSFFSQQRNEMKTEWT